jgi:hypothetical protein
MLKLRLSRNQRCCRHQPDPRLGAWRARRLARISALAREVDLETSAVVRQRYQILNDTTAVIAPIRTCANGR